MKKAMMEKWVKALESGQYQQGMEYLNMEGNYCCLGVLCEITNIPKSQDGVFTNYSGSNCILTSTVQKKLDIKSDIGNFHGEEVKWPRGMKKFKTDASCLAELNDHGATFKQIAKFIRLNYKVL